MGKVNGKPKGVVAIHRAPFAGDIAMTTTRDNSFEAPNTERGKRRKVNGKPKKSTKKK